MADDARTSPKTARKHLQALADEGSVAPTFSELGDVATDALEDVDGNLDALEDVDGNLDAREGDG